MTEPLTPLPCPACGKVVSRVLAATEVMEKQMYSALGYLNNTRAEVKHRGVDPKWEDAAYIDYMRYSIMLDALRK